MSVPHKISPNIAGKRKCSRGFEDRSLPGSPQMPSDGSEGLSKRSRILGPALPPPVLGDRSSPKPASETSAPQGKEQTHIEGNRERDNSVSSNSHSDSSSDSDFGPAPPSQGAILPGASQNPVDFNEMTSEKTQAIEPQKAERDAWMTMPPKQDDLSARFDPTKLRARKFNTGRGITASGASSDMGTSSLWTETPEQKRKRLTDEVMGVQSKNEMNRKRTESGVGESKVAGQGGEKDNAQRRLIAEKIKNHAEKTRGQSLYASHQARSRKTVDKEEEDDPSSRPFNREKDIASGAQVGHIKRREMIGRAADFGSKFSGGNFL